MKTSIRTDTKLWVFWLSEEGESSTAKGACPAEGGIYVFGYTWFEARTGALAALQRSSGLVHGREIENIKEHIVEEGSTIAFVDRGSTWFEIVETCRQMSGEEARTLLAFPAFGEASPTSEPAASEPAAPAEPGSEKTRDEEGILPLGHVGHAAEPAVPAGLGSECLVKPAVEPEPASSRVYPSSEALRALLNANAEHNSDWPEMAHIASQAIDALEAMELKLSDYDPFEKLVAYGAEIFRLREEVKTIELARFRAARQAEDYRVLGAKQEKALHMARQGEKDCRIQLEAAVERIYEMERGEDLLKAQKEVAYDERNRLVAVFASMALALGWKAGISLHQDPASGGASPQAEWDPEWRTLVLVETPEGQAAWHFHDSQKHLVAHLPSYVAKWDGHDAPTKYMRLERLGCIRFEPAPAHAGVAPDPDQGQEQLTAEYERGKEEADELHLRMLELRDAEAYKRGLREAVEVCQAVSSKMNERGKAKVFADAIVGTAQWEQRQRYEAGRDVAHDCGTRIEALAKKAST